jgi:hypothetical protein
MANGRKPKSGENGVEFFSVRAAGLTVAYRRDTENDLRFGYAWRNKGDQNDGVISRKIALSRLENMPLCISGAVEGKERAAIINYVDGAAHQFMFGASVLNKWSKAKKNLKFIQNSCK